MICCLISAVIVIMLVSRYERQADRAEVRGDVPVDPPVEKILKVIDQGAAKDIPDKEKEQPEKEMPLKEGEPLLF
jgi:hypothetical protein